MGSIRRSKTKRRTRDIDLIHKDMRSTKKMNQVEPFKAAEDLPGLGRFYCVQCAKWFESEPNLLHHRRGKKHKRRVRLLQEEPYTQKEAEAAVRLSTDNGTASESLRTTKDSEPMDIER